eukprot:762985-Hanusia_phi.AAC.1
MNTTLHTRHTKNTKECKRIHGLPSWSSSSDQHDPAATSCCGLMLDALEAMMTFGRMSVGMSCFLCSIYDAGEVLYLMSTDDVGSPGVPLCVIIVVCDHMPLGRPSVVYDVIR